MKMSDPDALISGAERALWIKRDRKNMAISVEDCPPSFIETPDSKEWSRIVNLALGSKARVVVITDDGRDAP